MDRIMGATGGINLYLVSSVSHLEIPHLDGQELRAFKNLAVSV